MSDAQLLAELVRIKALFQLRAIELIIRGPLVSAPQPSRTAQTSAVSNQTGRVAEGAPVQKERAL